MKTIIVKHPIQMPSTGNGKQTLGYARVSSNTAGYGDLTPFYIGLTDINGTSHHFEVSNETFSAIQQRRMALLLENTQFLYLWIETENNGSVLNWALFKSPLTLSQIHPIFAASYDFAAFLHLFELTESIQLIPLRLFMRELLGETALMTLFVSLPASRRHHHSFPGGLLAHSIECALLTRQTVQSLTEISQNEAEVAMVAALLHDIGKLKTLGYDKHTSLGRLIDHEQFTLALLAPALEKLRNCWEQSADALQYLLIWKESMGVCRFVSGNAIKMADRLSTAASLNRMAFKDKPDYFHFAQLQIGSHMHYLNRLN